MRCLHEAALHEDNAFITLTYEPQYLPEGGTLIKKHFQDFMKRLRKKYGGRRISYFHCGEYGEQKRRPHYHAILFGLRFVDQQFYSRGADGTFLYTSDELSRLWPFGFATVGEVTFESAAYVARYAVKKLSFYGEDAYEHIDLDTGEILPLQPEYTTMSLKPAIGKEWYGRFKGDVYPSDEVIVRGKVMKPPKYYDKLLEQDSAEAHAQMKALRLGDALERAHDNTKARLLVREEVKIAQTQNLKRKVE